MAPAPKGNIMMSRFPETGFVCTAPLSALPALGLLWRWRFRVSRGSRRRGRHSRLFRVKVRRCTTSRSAILCQPDTQTLQFPRLLSAIEHAGIRRALKPYIRTDNGWTASFLFFANPHSKNLPALVDRIFEMVGLADVESGKNQVLLLLSRLGAESFFNDARRLNLQLPVARPTRLTSAALHASNRDASFGPMGWQLIDVPHASGAFGGKAVARTASDRGSLFGFLRWIRLTRLWAASQASLVFDR